MEANPGWLSQEALWTGVSLRRPVSPLERKASHPCLNAIMMRRLQERSWISAKRRALPKQPFPRIDPMILPKDLVLHVSTFLALGDLVPWAATCHSAHALLSPVVALGQVMDVRKSAELSGRHIGDEDVRRTLGHKPPRKSRQPLRSISLNCCPSLSGSATSLLLHDYSKTLSQVDVSRCPWITDANASLFCGANLEKISLVGCSATDALLGTLSTSCQRLVELNVSHCGRMTTKGLSYVVAKHSPTLTSLGLVGFSAPMNARDRMKLITLLGQCRQLERLQLGDPAMSVCTTVGIDDDFVEAIAPQCIQLRRLSLVHCSKLTGSGLATVAQCCKELATLDLTGSGITNQGLEQLSYAARASRVNTKISSLCLEWCSKVSDRGLVACSAFTRLSTLRLRAQSFAPETLNKLLLVTRLSKLQWGNSDMAKKWVQMTKETASSFGIVSPTLCELHFSACDGVTLTDICEARRALPSLLICYCDDQMAWIPSLMRE